VASDIRMPIAAAAAAGIERTRYTIREGLDTGKPGDDPKVCLAIKAHDEEAFALVEPCIPALLARGMHVERGLDIHGAVRIYHLYYFWDGLPGTLTDVRPRTARFAQGRGGGSSRVPGVWPWIGFVGRTKE